MKSTIFLILCCLAATVAGQSQPGPTTYDVVFLKDGHRHVGQILKYEQGKKLVLEEIGGAEVSIAERKILKILQGVTLAEESTMDNFELETPRVFDLRTEGLYNVNTLAFALGGVDNSVTMGAGFSTVLGRQFSPRLGAGIGFGIDNYARRGESVYPIFAELRSYLPLKRKPFAYYFTLAGGYGLAFERASLGVRQAEGGFMVRPSVGYRSATQEGVEVNLELGVKLQKATFTHDLQNGDVQYRDLLFQRFVLRAGLALWK